MTHLLEVDDLTVSFSTLRRRLVVLDGVRFAIGRGEILGVVGESGSGKSVSALAIMRLLGEQGAIDRGRIVLDDVELTALDGAAMLSVRGRDVAMIFQEPMTSLNPVYTVGFQIAEVLIEHLGMARAAALERAAGLMDEVGIPAARQRLADYPHQLSGGMRQRVMIAMALACQPKLLIADEPTTALDVTIQAQILELIRRLRDEHGTAVLLITHDMGVIAEMADRVVVMYAGQVVEQAPVGRLFADPRHPYTRLLLRSVPRVQVRPERLLAIEGNIPSPATLPAGCRFHPRCPDAIERCRSEPPRLDRYDEERTVRCWRARESGLRSALEPAVGRA
jgi:oligopeptide/dipeptide ABC transporter ATP-binding protein